MDPIIIILIRTWDLPMREKHDIGVEDLKHFSPKDIKELSGLGISIFPVVLPIFLITRNTITDMLAKGNEENLSGAEMNVTRIFSFLGDANITLFISATIAMVTAIGVMSGALGPVFNSIRLIWPWPSGGAPTFSHG